MIDKKWKLYFSRDGGWYASADCNDMAATIRITTYEKNYPTFEDCYSVLEAKIKLHEEAKIS